MHFKYLEKLEFEDLVNQKKELEHTLQPVIDSGAGSTVLNRRRPRGEQPLH
jgi:hypothetical protein